MKKLILIISTIFLFTGCTRILEIYTEPTVKPTSRRQVQYYNYSLYYSYYIQHSIYGGFYLYLHPSYFGYYNYSSYRNYPYQWGYKYGKKKSTSVITKRRLKAKSGITSKTVVKKRSSIKSQPTNAPQRKVVKAKGKVKKK